MGVHRGLGGGFQKGIALSPKEGSVTGGEQEQRGTGGGPEFFLGEEVADEDVGEQQWIECGDVPGNKLVGLPIDWVFIMFILSGNN